MAGINTLLQLGKGAGLNIPQGVIDAGMFIGNPGMFMLNKALGAIEAQAGLPVGLSQAVQNPKGELIDFAKTQAANSVLGTEDVSNLEQLLYQLQPNQFDQARSAGENATPVPSSIADFEVTPTDLASIFGKQDNIMQAEPTSYSKTGYPGGIPGYDGYEQYGGGSNKSDFEALVESYGHGGQICGCKR